MKIHKGIWLPDGEEHLTMMLDKAPMVNGFGAYQYHKYKQVLLRTKTRDTAVDVGAHVGLWSMHFVRDFNQVESFEPCRTHNECFHKNMEAQSAPNNWSLNTVACGEVEGLVRMRTNSKSSGDTWPETLKENPHGETAGLVRIDDYDFEQVSLIKLDCEGYELFALRGAEKTILRSQPTIIVEQKPGRAQKFGLEETQAVTYLQGLGMKLDLVMSGDFILTWDY